jgi:hypothetical protein
MTEKTKPPVAEYLEQAMKNYDQALKAGLKLQEEAGKCLTGFMTQPCGAPDWQKLTTSANEVIPLAQKRMEECLAIVDQNSKASVELLRKAVDAASTTTFAESQAKWTKCYEGALEALRTNAQAVNQFSTKLFDSWTESVRKNAQTMAEPKPAKP